MLAAPIATAPCEVQLTLLETDYVSPCVQFIYEYLEDLHLPAQKTKEHFVSLLALIDDKCLSLKSKDLDYGIDDIDLKNSIINIISVVEKAIFEGIYQSLYTLLHEYYLNKNPDKPEDVLKNAQAAEQVESRHLTRSELFDQTKPLLGTLSHRLGRFGDLLNPDQIKIIVFSTIKKAKNAVLNPPEKAPPTPAQALAPTFLQKYRGPAFWKEVQEAKDAALAEQLIRDDQEALSLAFIQRGVFDENANFEEDEEEADALLAQAANEHHEKPDANEEEGDDEDEDQDADSSHSPPPLRRSP